jgi:hypothetical protein
MEPTRQLFCGIMSRRRGSFGAVGLTKNYFLSREKRTTVEVPLKLGLVSCAVALLSIVPLLGQSSPSIHHHQHLFSSATAAHERQVD